MAHAARGRTSRTYSRIQYVRGPHVWVEQERILDKVGQPMPVEDIYIAATARRHGLTIVAGNDRDFRRPGLKVFNPFEELKQ